VYHDNNLLQSLLITAVIADVESENGRGNSAIVEWALSAGLRDFDKFGSKAVNFLTNETLQATHLFAIVGDGFSKPLEMDPTELTTMIKEARGALQWICGNPEEREAYRFEPNNRGDGHEFLEQMSGLAELGYDLYNGLILRHGDDFERKLQAALAEPAVIQVARMRSAKFVFPWAIVYDLPIIPHRSNRMCPEFEATLAGGATAQVLAEHRCITQGCPYRDDEIVVCPSGFWGFRHVIEQPLATVQDPAQGQSPTSDAIDTIKVAINQPVEILNAYSKNLKFHDQHCEEVESLRGVQTDADFDLFRIGKGLKRRDLDVVYFYCHGGNRRGKAWLGVGAEPPEQLYASNLRAWKVSWPTRHPLVVINGCNTVGISPDDLLTFNEMLAWSRAAGVLGSEITIPETLGRFFGRRLLEGFVAGRHIGELVRELRFELLAGFNPLGLAYTPYSLAKLHIARA